MDRIRQYLLCVTAAALLCAVVKALIGTKGTSGTIINVMTGLFMAVTVVSGWKNLGDGGVLQFTDDFSLDAQRAIQIGQEMADESMEVIIKEQATAYILDKADGFGLDITVEVEMSDSSPPVPCSVKIDGEVSPYAKAQLTDIITNDLGIGAENQTWT